MSAPAHGGGGGSSGTVALAIFAIIVVASIVMALIDFGAERERMRLGINPAPRTTYPGVQTGPTSFPQVDEVFKSL